MRRPKFHLPGKVVWARRGILARFSPEIETAFHVHYEADLVQRARWSALIAALVMSVYVVLDVFMMPPEVVNQVIVARVLFMIVPLIFVWWIGRRESVAPHVQKIAAAASVSSALAVVYMIAIARHNGTPIEYEGLILTIFYYYCCGGLRIRWAMLAGSTAAVAYPVAEHLAGMRVEDLAVRSLFIISANVVGIVGTALTELAARRNFAHMIELAAMSNADPLTGILNRRAQESRLPALWDEAIRTGQCVQIVMIDVDYFKAYNDHYGHDGGDKALRSVALLLSRQSRNAHDLTVRYGGEEFLCMWLGRPGLTLPQRLERLLQEMQELDTPHARSPLQRLSLSIGAIELHAEPCGSPAEAGPAAIRAADALLYQAKAQGRNQAVVITGWTAAAGTGWSEPQTIRPPVS